MIIIFLTNSTTPLPYADMIQIRFKGSKEISPLSQSVRLPQWLFIQFTFKDTLPVKRLSTNLPVHHSR